MMLASSRDDGVAGLARFVRAHRTNILDAWRDRIASLPPSNAASLVTHGTAVLDWLARSLEDDARNDEIPQGLPGGESFSPPRAIAELALLAETLAQLEPASNQLARDALHRVIDAAIAHSLARDSDENDRLRKRLRLATDVTLVGCWDLDPVTGVVGADARSRELFCIVEGDAATVEALTSRLHTDDRDRVRAGIEQTLASGEAYMDDCRTLRPDAGGHRWIAVAADSHQSAGSRLPRVLGIVHDITDRKRGEEEHARVVEELSRAVHISEMFVGILSHDLRNPLSAILGGAQLLGADARDEKSARVLRLVTSSGERMGRMIDQLLDFTRTRLGEGIPLERDTVDLAELASSAIDEGKAASAASVLRLTARGDTTGVWDRDRVCQILSNLVGNAVQHGTPSGTIDLVLDGTSADSVRLSVENQGVIPAHLVPVIFNPFRGTLQKRGKAKGLGLGLYVARQIALAHGGELTVASTTTGTAFTLTLPRGESAAVSTRQLDFVREEELAAFERMAAPPSVSAITAQLFGATPLHERAPLEYSDIVERYGALLHTALHRKAYRGQGEGLADDLRELGERLGDLGAGPREVTEVHARALKVAVRGVTAAKTQALLAEGRLLALELMGNLASFYRRRSRSNVRAAAGKKSTP
jgi:signal transduction histidine kinase